MPGKLSDNKHGKKEAGTVANAEYSRCNAIRVAARLLFACPIQGMNE